MQKVVKLWQIKVFLNTKIKKDVFVGMELAKRILKALKTRIRVDRILGEEKEVE